MDPRIENMSRRISNAASIFADPRRVAATLSLIQQPFLGASEIPNERQTLSTMVKRLEMLQERGVLDSRKFGSHRRYQVVPRKKTVDILNALLEFGKYVR